MIQAKQVKYTVYRKKERHKNKTNEIDAMNHQRQNQMKIRARVHN
jgi:hypothetical protein